VRLLDRAPDGTWEVACEPDADTLTRSAGEVPLPPYLGRAAEPEDAERYQTIFAAGGGEGMRGAAAPTAGLHFTHALVRTLRARGVHFARVTLEVGAGTFQPLGPEALATGQLHAERFFVPSASWSLVTAARAAGCRVVAVGTTAARVLESAEGPGAGVTRLFIRPGYEFRRVDVLLTNFHLPRSSLLMLVSAFGGHARLRDAYRHAIAGSYRFFSYGDAMWLEPESPPAPD
jgi:S-adenosylmethionine:tRNA ribosyltransferase-isomerase